MLKLPDARKAALPTWVPDPLAVLHGLDVIAGMEAVDLCAAHQVSV